MISITSKYDTVSQLPYNMCRHYVTLISVEHSLFFVALEFTQWWVHGDHFKHHTSIVILSINLNRGAWAIFPGAQPTEQPRCDPGGG